GINNTIKVIKRRAYGYRDEQYFFLKKISATQSTNTRTFGDRCRLCG
ncbi:transposase, partial [Burkholderia pseudomallei]